MKTRFLVGFSYCIRNWDQVSSGDTFCFFFQPVQITSTWYLKMEPLSVDWFRIIWWLVWGWQLGVACLTGQLTDFSLVLEMFSRYLGRQCCKDLNEEVHKSINCYVILFAAWKVQLENHSSLAVSIAVFYHVNDLLQRSYCFIGSFCRLNWSYIQWWWTVLLAICIFLILFKVWTFNKLEKSL